MSGTPTQHGCRTQHSALTALHTLSDTVAEGFSQVAPLMRTITVALDMSKAFDTLDMHTLIRKLLHTNIPGTIMKFIANYINRRTAYTTYRNHISIQGEVCSPTLVNIYTADLPPPREPVQVMAYADDIIITSIHKTTSAAKKHIQPVGLHSRIAQKTVNRAPIAGSGRFRHNLHSSL